MRTRRRKIIVYISTSADGFIARSDGGIDWLDRPRTAGDYGMSTFYRSIDTILWGRKTYDLALEFQRRGVKGTEFPTTKRNYAFSRHPPTDIAPGVEFVSDPLASFVERLRAAPGTNIWVMGGGGLIGSLLDANAIDEFIIHVIPIFIGEGIPLMAPCHRTAPLTLRSTKRYSDGVVRLHYALVNS